MRWVAVVLAAVLVMAAGMGDAQAPPVKLALVIGNADYDGDGRIDASAAGVASSESRGFVQDLRNPLNDAADIQDALTRIGFRVDRVSNADAAAMSSALAAFGTKVAAAPDTAQIVVYYAGHAIQVDGANFLIPVKAQLPATDFSTMPTSQVQTVLRRVAVSTTEITEQLKQLRAPGVNLLMFDACRNNPWETRVRGLGRSVGATRGLAEIAAPPRTVIAFSTAPGRTADDGAGRNSPFADALKDWVGKPGTVLQTLDGVGDAVQTATAGRQTPWFQSASVGQVCLASCVVAPTNAGVLKQPRDVRQLTPLVKNAVISARSVAARALQEEGQAHQAQQLAAEAVLRAQRGERGTNIVTKADGARYSGEWRNGKENGYGMLIVGDHSPQSGDTYAGHWVDGYFSGSGVYVFANNPSNMSNFASYGGQFSNDRRHGLGVARWRNGQHLAGQFKDDEFGGLGVGVLSDGRSIEGELNKFGGADGYFAQWTPQGELQQSGRAVGGRIVSTGE